MVAYFFPKGFSQYQQLPLLGRLADSFAVQLRRQGYCWSSGRQHLQMAGHICRYLARRWKGRLSELCEEDLRPGALWFRRRFPNNGCDARVFVRFSREHGLIKPARVVTPTGVYVQLNCFAAHLRDAHGYASSKVQRRVQIATEFLQWLRFDKAPHRLASLSISDVERFIGHSPCVPSRETSTCSSLAHCRSIFAVDRSRLPHGETRLRMFALMTTYGLRACDIVSLTLDDIQWRIRRVPPGLEIVRLWAIAVPPYF